MQKYTYDIDYEINKRRSYMKHMSPYQLDYEMQNGAISVPTPTVCPGICHIDKCPRALVINAIYRSDPCEYCSHSLDLKYVRNQQNQSNQK